MKFGIFFTFLGISILPNSVYAVGVLIPKEILVKIEAKAAVDFPND